MDVIEGPGSSWRSSPLLVSGRTYIDVSLGGRGRVAREFVFSSTVVVAEEDANVKDDTELTTVDWGRRAAFANLFLCFLVRYCSGLPFFADFPGIFSLTPVRIDANSGVGRVGRGPALSDRSGDPDPSGMTAPRPRQSGRLIGLTDIGSGKPEGTAVVLVSARTSMKGGILRTL